MTTEELRKEILDEIRSSLPDGHCVDMNVSLGKEPEPHHCDMYWDRCLTCLYHYKGHLIYASSGCYASDLEEITLPGMLVDVLHGMLFRQPSPISEETARMLDGEYMHWGRKEWENGRHSFMYWLWDGHEQSGPFPVGREMTLDEASDYVKEKFAGTKYRSFDLQEVGGPDDTYYHYGINTEG